MGSTERGKDYSYRDQQWKDERSKRRGSIFWEIQYFIEMGMTASEITFAKELTDGAKFDPVKFAPARIQNAITKASRRVTNLVRQREESAATRKSVAMGEFKPEILAKRVALWLEVDKILQKREVETKPQTRREWKLLIDFLSARQYQASGKDKDAIAVFDRRLNDVESEVLTRLLPCFKAIRDANMNTQVWQPRLMGLAVHGEVKPGEGS